MIFYLLMLVRKSLFDWTKGGNIDEEIEQLESSEQKSKKELKE